jgi:hypothetical protein
MATYCILGIGGVVEATFANSQLPTTQARYTEIQVDGGQVGQVWNGTAFVDNLAMAQAAQIAALTAAYEAAYQQPVSYTTKGGVTKTFSADNVSIGNLQSMLLAFQVAATVSSGFYWLATDNTQVPFVYADMQAMAEIIGAQGLAAFQKLQALEAKVNAATTVAAVQAVVWS